MGNGGSSGEPSGEGRKRRPRRRPTPGSPRRAPGTPGAPGAPGPSGKPGAERRPGPPSGNTGPGGSEEPVDRGGPQGPRPAPGRQRPPAKPAPTPQAAEGDTVAFRRDRDDAPGRAPVKAGPERQSAASPVGAPAAAPAGPPRFAKRLTTASIIGWTGLSAILPGAAHLRAGRRRTGFVLLGVFGAILIAAIVFGLQVFNDTGMVARDSTLITVSATAGVLALTWFALVLISYITLRPSRLNKTGQIVSGIAAGMLCVVVMAPFALAASSIVTAREAINAIFPSDPDGAHIGPIKAEDPWQGRDRVNFLMIGGDAAGNRTGVRTDTMMVASVHVKTGNTVMFSLPRNLQYVRFPAGNPLAAKFPNGFTGEDGQGLLNEVWYYADMNPHLVGGKGQGPRMLKDAIGHTLGLKIDYYALVNMYGFAKLVDAIGGLNIRVQYDVKWGGLYGTAGTIKAGYRKLSGEEALWYGRSRVGSDDFSRMERQRCVIGALTQQATPAVLLQNFNRIAGATKQMVRTDIPRDLLEHLVPLGMKVKDAKLSSVALVPPLIHTGNPDWHKIRVVAAKALRDSLRPDRRALAAGVTATPSTSPSASTTATATRPAPATTPLRTPTAHRTPTNGANAKNINDGCV
ncbi:LCP family protein [Sinosporangium siamense]|uniref:Cell envelope-related transcriptional attenuator domain-containing protein n=1 Tax=Sinosporangium siamense TaxID=1367973 RepID=A0A919RKL3_9ACTN|nr:LCP family protein [Sinosporangium siamense]GII93776.1 hypothetical protein Ssi02_40070 [Sinosporangium siamense]